MLTPQQITAARDLLGSRPTVIPGTRAILNDTDRKRWFDEVSEALTRLRVDSAIDVSEFCDLAGVAD